mgnify:CR=1 FL=1
MKDKISIILPIFNVGPHLRGGIDSLINQTIGNENLEIINRFHGVSKKKNGSIPFFETKIHVNGDYIVGRYPDEITAAVAYNKAATILIKKGYDKAYPVNFIEETDSETYKKLFQSVSVSKKIRELPQKEEPHSTV